MFYYLLRFLDGRFNIPGAGVLQYVTVRAILAIIFALFFSIWFGKRFIGYMKRHNISEVQRDAKIDPFNVNKKGVPTMGGIIIISSMLIPCLLFGKIGMLFSVKSFMFSKSSLLPLNDTVFSLEFKSILYSLYFCYSILP